MTSSLCSFQENYRQATRIWITLVCLLVILSGKNSVPSSGQCDSTQHSCMSAFPGGGAVAAWHTSRALPCRAQRVKETYTYGARIIKTCFYCFAKDFLKWTGFFFSSFFLMWVCGHEEIKTTSTVAAAAVVVLAPSVLSSTQWQRQRMSWYIMKKFWFRGCLERALGTHKGPRSTLWVELVLRKIPNNFSL